MNHIQVSSMDEGIVNVTDTAEKVDGEFQIIRIALISVPKAFSKSFVFVWIAAE